MSWIFLVIGFIVANFSVQIIWDRNWERAVDRSVFQIVAVCVVYFVKPWIEQ